MKLRVIPDACGQPYLIRLTFFKFRGWSLKLHVILKSDDDRALHDHPWWFVTLPLVNGYVECWKDKNGLTRVHIVKPWRFYFRPAHWTHRLVLINPAVTLVLTGPMKRDWGFRTGFRYRKGWTKWSDFKSERDC